MENSVLNTNGADAAVVEAPLPAAAADILLQKSTVDQVGQEQLQQQLRPAVFKQKRKHRRGKPRPKNSNRPYKNNCNWKLPGPRANFKHQDVVGNNGAIAGAGVVAAGVGAGGVVAGVGGGGGGTVTYRNNNRNRNKLRRSNSLVPYNTNKFLMEYHLAEVPAAAFTPSGRGRTRDSSFSVDSEDNYFFSLPEDEEEFLTKEFANVYEKARVERLESLSKQELIEECLQIEDRYSTDQGAQRQQQLNIERISAEFNAKIKGLEEKLKELSRENYNLRCQLMRSAAIAAAAASPPSAAAPVGASSGPMLMESTSEDSESDSSTSSTSSSSSSSSSSTSTASDSCNNEEDYAYIEVEIEDSNSQRPASTNSAQSPANAVLLVNGDEQHMDTDDEDLLGAAEEINVNPLLTQSTAQAAQAVNVMNAAEPIAGDVADNVTDNSVAEQPTGGDVAAVEQHKSNSDASAPAAV